MNPPYSISVPASGLSNLRLAIPETAPRGSDVAFNCSFNLQDDDLYAVKWYRGTYEIFRRVRVKVSVGSEGRGWAKKCSLGYVNPAS